MKWSHTKVIVGQSFIVIKITFPKNKRTNLFFYADDSEILKAWNWNSSFKYFLVEKQICAFVVLKKLRLDSFLLRSTDLYYFFLSPIHIFEFGYQSFFRCSMILAPNSKQIYQRNKYLHTKKLKEDSRQRL